MAEIFEAGFFNILDKATDTYHSMLAIKGDKGDKGEKGDSPAAEEIRTQVAAEVAKVVNEAPESFDTLKEIADWIDTHEDDASAMNSAILANKREIADLKEVTPSVFESYSPLENSADAKAKKVTVYGNTHKSPNLLNPTLAWVDASGYSSDGVTYTYNSEKIITLNGTKSGSGGGKLGLIKPTNWEDGKYTISIWENGNLATDVLVGHGNVLSTSKVTVDINSTNKTSAFGVQGKQGVAYSNKQYVVMIEKGEYTESVLSYEPYGITSAGGYGLVDLGTLTWSKIDVAQGNLFRCQITNILDKTSNQNLFCAKYKTTIAENRTNGTIYQTTNRQVDVIDNSYADATTFKTAMQGVMLAYELADGATPSQYAEVIKEHNHNLIPFPYRDGMSKIVNGITFTVNVDGSITLNGTSTGLSTFNLIGEFSSTPNGVLLDANRRYIYTGTPTQNGSVAINTNIKCWKSDNTVVWVADYHNGAIIPADVKYAAFVIEIPNGATLSDCLFKPMLVEVAEDGTYPTEFNKREEHTTIIPLSSPLNGFNGIYDYIDENGEVHKIGVVDLGSLNWGYSSGVFYSAPSEMKKGTKQLYTNNFSIVATNFAWSSVASYADKSIITGDNANENVYIKDSSYTDATSFKTAMSGVMLYYELATETVTPLTAEQINAMADVRTFAPTTYIDVDNGGTCKVVFYGNSKLGEELAEVDADIKSLKAKVSKTLEIVSFNAETGELVTRTMT